MISATIHNHKMDGSSGIDTTELIFIPMQAHDTTEGSIERQLEAIADCVEKKLHNQRKHWEKNWEVELIAIPVADWNAQLSPWEAEGIRPGERFLGNGTQFMATLFSEIHSSVTKKENVGRKVSLYLAGYSLAGLFVLWSFFQSGTAEEMRASSCEFVRLFIDGVASCSGSLWFPGWDAFLQTINALNQQGLDNTEESTESTKGIQKVYLSLGVKEEATRNPQMALVGKNTRATENWLRAQGYQTLLEWNSGGHFHEIPQRIANGIVWLLANKE